MKINQIDPKSQDLIKQILQEQRPNFKVALIFSFVIGVLSLGSTVFMLEVYDRVVNSRNALTLLMLLIAVIGCYVALELLELIRKGVMQKVSDRLDDYFSVRLFDTAFEARIKGAPGGTTQALRDLKIIRDFMFSDAVMAIFDAPMALVCLLIVFWISPWLGAFALVGAAVQVWIATVTEKSTMPLLTMANQAAIESQMYAANGLRNAQVIEAMGMLGSIHKRWNALHRKFLMAQAEASDTAGANSASSKFIQGMQGSLILGVSCWLTLQGKMLGGGAMMIVASILGGKVLTPLVQLVAQWRLVINVRDSYRRLNELLNKVPLRQYGMPLPPPTGYLTVEGVVAGAPGSPMPILRGVSFAVQPGECVMIIGPSAAGKTTLARLLMGLWPATNGKVRLDGADVYTWNKKELGPHLGYLPQTVELFDGTVAENVARFGDVNLDEVKKVIDLVGLTETIALLPNGLDTFIGEDGAVLSGGQRQRVALARAIYGSPKLLVLDEPNSSLDEAGEVALLQTLSFLKQQGSSVLLITHRTSVLPAADKLLILREGLVAGFGPRDEILAALERSTQQAQQNALEQRIAAQASSQAQAESK